MNQHIHRVLCTQALFEASIHGHVDVVRMLLAHGANIDHAKNDGATALYGACENGHTSVASLLVESAANVRHARQWHSHVSFSCYSSRTIQMVEESEESESVQKIVFHRQFLCVHIRSMPMR